MNAEGEQLTLFDLGYFCGKMCPEPSPVETPRARTSASSLKRSSELSAIPFLSLDLTPGHGNLLGESYWEMISPWHGDALTLNTGVLPREEKESSLSRILQAEPPTKYYLSPKACLGILRRASERGKELPEKLKRALEIQAGVVSPDGKPTELNAFHINQRDEGIDLNGVSGALMATFNLQMQTFVTQPDECVEGFDGYNGDLTGDVAATLGVNCGMSTGRNGLLTPIGIDSKHACATGDIANTLATNCGSPTGRNGIFFPMAFTQNQRDEVRDLRDVAGALCTSHGTKQQTFIAGVTTLPNALYENHGRDSRYTGPYPVSPTISASAGTGGNNLPLVEQEPVYCIVGNVIDRQPQNGGNGKGYQEDIAYTLTATDHHAVFSRQRVDELRENEVVSTQSARQHKDATDLVCQPSVFGQSQFGNYQEGVSTLRAQGGDNGGGSENLIASEGTPGALLIRRLTPLECERLQGFPDGWTDIPKASDAARYKALGNSVAIPCVEYVLAGIATVLRLSR